MKFEIINDLNISKSFLVYKHVCCVCNLLDVTCLFIENISRGLKMEIVFKRMLTNELLTTYLPSLLLLCITYATTFFKSFFFEAALTVNLTVMLVLTTLFIRYLSSVDIFEQNILKCDGEVAIHLLCENGGHLVDLWSAHSIHRGHFADTEGTLQ